MKKRIAYISADPGVPVFGTKGCSVHVQEGVRALRRQGADVSLFAQRTGGAPSADLAEIPLYRLPKLDKSSILAREKSALAVNEIVLDMLQARGPFDLVYERYSLWGFAGMAHARSARIPGILEVNAPLIEEQRRHRTLLLEREAGSVIQRLAADASALIAVSDPVASYLEQFPGAKGKVHVIPNGVDPVRFSPDVVPSRGRLNSTFTVGFVGTLKPWHGVLDLVEAFAALYRAAPVSRLLIVGNGPERPSIESRVASLGLALVTHFTGAVHPDEVPGLVASMDVGVAPYPAMENCYFSPLKAFEYMSAGIAFVGSDIGQLGKIITNEREGLLYRPGDTRALAQHLLRLYKSPELRRALGRAARQKIVDTHAWDAVARQIMDIAETHNAFEVA